MVAFEPQVWRLRSGRSVTVRVVRADDGARLQDAVRRLSDESRYMRFMAYTRELSPQLLARVTHPSAGRELRLIAVTPDGEGQTIVAAASYVAIGDRDCEFAVAVADEWQRLGLAPRLLEALMQSARANGFERMDGYVLASNARMLALARRMGFTPVKNPEDPTVRVIRRDLTMPAGRGER